MAKKPPRRRKLRGKKLLIASAGLATLSFVSTGCGSESSQQQPTEEIAPPGNLVAPPPVVPVPVDAAEFPSSSSDCGASAGSLRHAHTSSSRLTDHDVRGMPTTV